MDPQKRAVTIWPQSELAIGAAKYSTGSTQDYQQDHYYVIDGLNAGSTTVSAYTSTNGQFVTIPANTPTTLFFAATAPLGATTQAFGPLYGSPSRHTSPSQGYSATARSTGRRSRTRTAIITNQNAYTTPTAGATAATVTVSCTTPCNFNPNSKAMVGWINSAGQLTQLTTFTTTAGGAGTRGRHLPGPDSSRGYYTIEVTDYVNSIFMTFQHT